MLSMKHVEPSKLSLDARFKFRCHKGISCFTQCCSNISIMLTPYDIIRLKKRLGLSSEKFLEDYTFIHIDEKSAHPFIYLNMSGERDKKCLFLSEGGCTVYDDRPASCRYYPVGQASLRKMDEVNNLAVTEEFYFFVKEDHCKGFEEDKAWTIRQWRDDQGVDIYDEMNRGWKDILFTKNMPGQEIDEKQQKTFYMACYDIDRFRRFVFESRFLEVFDLDASRVGKMRDDEIELMKFGFDYTKFVLMREQNLKVRQQGQL